MKRFAQTLGVTLGIVIVGSALLLVPQKNATGASPPITCRPVHGTIHSVFTTQNCTSPIGLCTAGTITEAGILDGSTTFVAGGVAPSAGIPSVEPSANLSYSGQLTIMATGGTLVTNDLGVLDANHLVLSEIDRPASERRYLRIRETVFSSYRDRLLTTAMDFRATSPAPFVPTVINSEHHRHHFLIRLT